MDKAFHERNIAEDIQACLIRGPLLTGELAIGCFLLRPERPKKCNPEQVLVSFLSAVRFNEKLNRSDPYLYRGTLAINRYCRNFLDFYIDEFMPALQKAIDNKTTYCRWIKTDENKNLPDSLQKDNFALHYPGNFAIGRAEFSFKRLKIPFEPEKRRRINAAKEFNESMLEFTSRNPGVLKAIFGVGDAYQPGVRCTKFACLGLNVIVEVQEKGEPTLSRFVEDRCISLSNRYGFAVSAKLLGIEAVSWAIVKGNKKFVKEVFSDARIYVSDEFEAACENAKKIVELPW